MNSTDAVIVGYGRSAVGKAGKGSLARVHPVDFGAETLTGVLNRVPELDPSMIDDLILGCALPEAALGLNPARNLVLRAGLPISIAGQTVNRFCSSGLQSIADATAQIRAGMAGVVVAGGLEHMSSPVLSDAFDYRAPWLAEHTDAYIPMGVTGENVARRYALTRTELDQLAVDSNAKAAAAQQAGYFDEQIVPVTGRGPDGTEFALRVDEGVRPGTNLEALAGLKASFGEDGLLTAATSSQRSDGAGFAVLMSFERAAALGIAPIARLLGFAVTGLDPAYMGLGPITAVPKVLAQVGLTLDQIDLVELNEAFASQAIVVVRELGLDPAKVNPNGGALALGHPLGATGAILTAKLLAELERRQARYGMVTMCVGGGMGAAGVFERC